MSNITCLRTIRIAERPNLIWVEIETDDGLIGLGESFRGAQATEAVIHEQIAPWLLGRDARRIEAVSRQLTTPYLGFHSAGAEIRAASAIDIALWDMAGKRSVVPFVTKSAPTIPALVTHTIRPAWRAGRLGPERRRLARTMTRSPSRATQVHWRKACCPKALPR